MVSTKQGHHFLLERGVIFCLLSVSAIFLKCISSFPKSKHFLNDSLLSLMEDSKACNDFLAVLWERSWGLVFFDVVFPEGHSYAAFSP